MAGQEADQSVPVHTSLPESMTGQSRRGRNNKKETRPPPDAKTEGRKRIEAVEKEELAKFQVENKNQLNVEAQVDFANAMQARLTAELKNELLDQTSEALDIQEYIEIQNQIPAEYAADVNKITTTLSALANAIKAGYITPPDHEATREVFDSISQKLYEVVSMQSSSYLHPFMKGMLTEPQYISFSTGDDLTTPFERDLKRIIGGEGRARRVEELLRDAIGDAIKKGKIPGMSLERLLSKIGKSQEEKKKENDLLRIEAIEANKRLTEEQRNLEKAQRREMRAANLDNDIIEILDAAIDQKDEQSAQALEAKKLLVSMENASTFFTYYKFRYDAKLEHAINAELGRVGTIAEISDPEKRDAVVERAAKETSEDIHKVLMYMTHLIYTPVIEGDPSKSWQELLQKASGSYGVNPQTLFNHFRNKFTYLVGQSSTLPGDYEQQVKFFNFGLEEREVFMFGDGELQGGKMLRKKVTTSELTEMETFKEWIDRMHVALDAEENFLTAGINFNYLLLTGQTEGEASFFEQAAKYAHQTLHSQSIDELYHLPYHELVHAAKIQLSSYFKREFAMNDWMKDPALFYQAFEHNNKAQREALFNLIRNFASEDTPEWAIRRAFLHARMHLSLISQEWHSYAGYGHANLTEDFQPTYTDTAMNGLDTYRTWFPGEQWQVGDTFIQNMAFLPQPNRTQRYDEWIHEDVTAEGQEIFRKASHIGELAGLGTKYFIDTGGSVIMPNIFEFNHLKIGGVEQQGGWRFKYPASSWVFDMLNHLGQDNESLIIDTDGESATGNDHRNLEFAWKRLENLGVDVMKMFRDSWLTSNGDFIKLKGDKTEYDEEWKHFFGFLYRRYFSDEKSIGKKGFSISYKDAQLNEHSIDFADITGEEDFWNRVVKPILHRKPTKADEETDQQARKRNDAEREGSLKEIVTHALTVMAFERLPMDFVFMENPTRSQNGLTLMKELQSKYITTDPKIDEEGNREQVQQFKRALDDILYVQAKARAKSIEQMNVFVKEQQDKARTGGIKERQRTIFGESLESLKGDFSDVHLIDDMPEHKGYIVDELVMENYLREKYKRDPEMKHHLGSEDAEVRRKANEELEHAITLAKDMFAFTKKQIQARPEENPLLKSEISLKQVIGDDRIKREMMYRGILPRILKDDKRDLTPHEQELFDQFKVEYLKEMKETFDKAQEGLSTRAMWSENELLSGVLGIGLNDVAYPFLSFASVGPNMISRTIEQIHGTQEEIFNYIAGGKMLSDLKKYYRKEDKAEFFEHVSDVRSAIKNWMGAEEYDGTAMRMVENAMNVMRINSDAEDNAVELAYMTRHRKRSAFSGVVKEGPEFPLRREERYGFVSEFMHYAQFPKRSEDMVIEFVPGVSYEEQLKEKWGEIGEKLGEIVDWMWPSDSKLVRQKWKELSGEGIRSREFATLVDIFVKYGGVTYGSLVFVALFVLLIKGGYEKAQED